MKCKKFKILLSASIDGVLNQTDLAEIQEHLETCIVCRNNLEMLNNYKNIVEAIEFKKAPNDLQQKIKMNIRQKQTQVISPGRKRGIYLTLKIAGIAAAIIFALYLVVPDEYYHTPRIQIDYSYEVRKSGKGSKKGKVDGANESAPIEKIREICCKAEGRIMEENYNQKTGLPDFIRVRIRKDSLESFRKLYNEGRESDTIARFNSKSISNSIDIQIFIPGREFLSCDLNGDGYKDILAYYRQGRFAGSWFASLNVGKAKFLAAQQITLNDTLKFVPLQAALLSGDINGDHFDDLIVQIRLGKGAGKWYCYLNNKKNGFDSGKLLSIYGGNAIYLGINTPLTGDLNGDGLADIGAHFRKGEMAGKWIFSMNNGNGSFGPGQIIPVNFSGTGTEDRYTPFILDFNRDQMDDFGIYWSGTNSGACGKWIISINCGNGMFEKEKQVLYAFCGNYSPFFGDFSGDGYDEFCIKSGTPDETGEWLIIYNSKEGLFDKKSFQAAFNDSPEFKILNKTND